MKMNNKHKIHKIDNCWQDRERGKFMQKEGTVHSFDNVLSQVG